MKKNIVIIILLAIIVFLSVKLLNPTVVTSRKVEPQQVLTTTPEPVIRPIAGNHEFKSELLNKYNSDANSLSKPNVYQTQQPIYKENQRIYSSQNEYHNYPKQEFKPLSQNIRVQQTEVRQISGQNQIQSNAAGVAQNSLENNIKTCKPYSESMSTEYAGMKTDYNIEILGWQNNKCILNFTSKIDGVGPSFEEEYGVRASDVQIVGFAPKIRCAFTKEQLNYVGDSVLQEEERNNGARNNMLKNPNDINFSNFSSSDVKLLQIIMNDRACEVTNLQDLNKMFEGLMQLF